MVVLCLKATHTVERAKTLDLEGPGFKSQLSYFLAMWTWFTLCSLLWLRIHDTKWQTIVAYPISISQLSLPIKPWFHLELKCTHSPIWHSSGPWAMSRNNWAQQLGRRFLKGQPGLAWTSPLAIFPLPLEPGHNDWRDSKPSCNHEVTNRRRKAYTLRMAEWEDGKSWSLMALQDPQWALGYPS